MCANTPTYRRHCVFVVVAFSLSCFYFLGRRQMGVTWVILEIGAYGVSLVISMMTQVSGEFNVYCSAALVKALIRNRCR